MPLPDTLWRNTALNLLGQGAPLLAALAAVPWMLEVYGDARFGYLVLAMLVVGYFGLFDLGVGPALAQRWSRMGQSQPDRCAQTLRTALALGACLGIVGGLVAWLAAHVYFGSVVPGGDAMHNELAEALPWFVAAVPLASVCGVLNAALQARERFAALNLAQATGALAIQFGPLLAATRLGATLDVAMLSIVAARLLLLCLLAGCVRTDPAARRGALWANDDARALLAQGGWLTVSGIVGPLMVALDRFVLGQAMGARSVAAYAAPFQIAEKTTLLSASLNQALFPRLAAASPQDRFDLLTQAHQRVAWLTAPLVLVAVVLTGPFLSWWLGAERAAVGESAAQLLLLGFWFNGMALVPYTALIADARPSVVAKAHLAELIPYLLVLMLAVNAWGLAGAALAFTLRTAADWLLLSALSGAMRPALRAAAMPAVVLTAATAAFVLWA